MYPFKKSEKKREIQGVKMGTARVTEAFYLLSEGRCFPIYIIP